ncbi:hypothetical protein Nmel_003111, partial [Mimus melanotis]
KLLGILANFLEGSWTERRSTENKKEAGLPRLREGRGGDAVGGTADASLGCGVG